MYSNDGYIGRIEFFGEDGNSILIAGNQAFKDKKEEIVLGDDECIMGIIA